MTKRTQTLRRASSVLAAITRAKGRGGKLTPEIEATRERLRVAAAAYRAASAPAHSRLHDSYFIPRRGASMTDQELADLVRYRRAERAYHRRMAILRALLIVMGAVAWAFAMAVLLFG